MAAINGNFSVGNNVATKRSSCKGGSCAKKSGCATSCAKGKSCANGSCSAGQVAGAVAQGVGSAAKGGIEQVAQLIVQILGALTGQQPAAQ